MKKIYLQPVTRMVKIETVTMSATSVGVGADWTSGSAEGRGNDDIWDDED